MNSSPSVQSVLFLSFFGVLSLLSSSLLAGATNSSEGGGKKGRNFQASSSSGFRTSSGSGGSSSSARGIPHVDSFEDPPAPRAGRNGLVLQAPRWEVQDGVARIVGTSPTPAQFQTLLARFPQGVHALNFANLHLDGDSIAHLVQWLLEGHGSNIRGLSFENTPVGHTEQFVLLLEVLAHQVPLERLNLAHTGLANAGMVALISGIRGGGFAQLRILNLSLNSYDNAHAVLLADTLCEHPINSLEELDIHDETIEQIQTRRTRLQERLEQAYQELFTPSNEHQRQPAPRQNIVESILEIMQLQQSAPEVLDQAVSQAMAVMRPFLDAADRVGRAYQDLTRAIRDNQQMGDEVADHVQVAAGVSSFSDTPGTIYLSPLPGIIALIAPLRNALSELARSRSVTSFEAILSELEESFQRARRLVDAYQRVLDSKEKLSIKLPRRCAVFSTERGYESFERQRILGGNSSQVLSSSAFADSSSSSARLIFNDLADDYPPPVAGTGLVAQPRPQPPAQVDEPRWDIEGDNARLIGPNPTVDQFAALLERLPRELNTLNLANTGLTNEHLAQLATWLNGSELWNIRNLNLESNAIGGDGVRFLADLVRGGHLSELRELHLAHNQIGQSDAFLSLMEAMNETNLSRLRVLDLTDNNFSEQSIQVFVHQVMWTNQFAAPNLNMDADTAARLGQEIQGQLNRSWEIQGTSARLVGVLPNQEFSEDLFRSVPAGTEVLDLSQAGLNNDHVYKLWHRIRDANLSRVRALVLDGNAIGGQRGLYPLLEELANISTLTRLSLRAIGLDNYGAGELANLIARGGFPGLQILELDQNDFDEEHAELIRAALAKSGRPAKTLDLGESKCSLQ